VETVVVVLEGCFSPFLLKTLEKGCEERYGLDLHRGTHFCFSHPLFNPLPLVTYSREEKRRA
jgi:hypothetical protein